MISALSSALAGLGLFRQRVDAASRNIANATTEGYRAVRVDAREGPTGAPVGRLVRPEAPGPVVLDDLRGPVELSNVDLTREMPELMLGERGFEANLQTVRTADEMLGTLLDLKR